MVESTTAENLDANYELLIGDFGRDGKAPGDKRISDIIDLEGFAWLECFEKEAEDCFRKADFKILDGSISKIDTNVYLLRYLIQHKGLRVGLGVKIDATPFGSWGLLTGEVAESAYSPTNCEFNRKTLNHFCKLYSRIPSDITNPKSISMRGAFSGYNTSTAGHLKFLAKSIYKAEKVVTSNIAESKPTMSEDSLVKDNLDTKKVQELSSIPDKCKIKIGMYSGGDTLARPIRDERRFAYLCYDAIKSGIEQAGFKTTMEYCKPNYGGHKSTIRLTFAIERDNCTLAFALYLNTILRNQSYFEVDYEVKQERQVYNYDDIKEWIKKFNSTVEGVDDPNILYDEFNKKAKDQLVRRLKDLTEMLRLR